MNIWKCDLCGNVIHETESYIMLDMKLDNYTTENGRIIGDSFSHSVHMKADVCRECAEKIYTLIENIKTQKGN